MHSNTQKPMPVLMKEEILAKKKRKIAMLNEEMNQQAKNEYYE